jgi:hypothetical protein
MGRDDAHARDRLNRLGSAGAGHRRRNGLLRPGSRPVGGSPDRLKVGRGPRRPAPAGLDDPGDLVECLGREERPHLVIARLPLLDAANRPELRE